jgi:membrane protein YqaA with SNARE-associated domain
VKNVSQKIKAWWKDFKHDLGRTAKALFYFALAGFAFWILLYLLEIFLGFNLFQYLGSLPFISPVYRAITAEIGSRSALGIFYFFCFTSLFFLPIPPEASYVLLLQGPTPASRIILFAMIGIIAGQTGNFLLGKIFGGIIKPYIKKKRRKWIYHKLEERGKFIIGVMNVIPFFPFQIFNVVVGFTKYPASRWFMMMVIGTVVKFGLLYFVA